MASPGTAPPLVPLRSEYERRNDRHPAIWHRHDPLTRRHRAHRRPRARCGPPPARPAARIAGYAHYASSGRPASPSGCAGRRTGHASHPLTDGRNHRGDTISGPRARGLGGAGGRCRRYGVPVGSSMGRPRPPLRAGGQGKGSLRRPLYDQFEARPHRGLAGPSPPPTHHLALPTPARSPSKSTRAMW